MPSLVTVSGERLELEHRRSYTLGRAADCDIVVSDVACSRRHARITVASSQSLALFIEDMGSRNGTFVNEERIWDRTAIKEGALVRVGATVYLLQMAGDDEDAELDTGTVAIEKFSLGTEIDDEMLRVIERDGPLSTHFAGKLETLGLLEVLQMLINGQRSGTLNLNLADGQGRIEVRGGEVHSALYQEMAGFMALVQMAHESKGTFWMVEKSTPCQRTIHESSSQLLIELCKAVDESPVS